MALVPWTLLPSKSAEVGQALGKVVEHHRFADSDSLKLMFRDV